MDLWKRARQLSCVAVMVGLLAAGWIGSGEKARNGGKRQGSYMYLDAGGVSYSFVYGPQDLWEPGHDSNNPFQTLRAWNAMREYPRHFGKP